MTLLHDYFHLRNQQAFQRLLDGSVDRGHSGGALSSSGSKSWTRPSPLASNAVYDVNARDWLGRTVLQLACASLDTVEYVKMLLGHPAINVNLADTESHWTPLHRALYNANLPAALLLLQHSDVDRSIQDYEGYTAFDLYNSTLNNTKPRSDSTFVELFTWGANRNAALGFADGGDRAQPDHVSIQKRDVDVDAESSYLVSRFLPIYVRQIQMSRLHTVVITSEGGGNLRLCGFGSGGRLGPSQHMQYSLKPLQQLTYIVVSVALGQDHTLALTKGGEVLSWGLNRFSQLGYIIEGPAASESFGKTDEPIQATPRKILGPLKKEIVKGVAASKTASVLPRKATKVTQPVIDISISDSAMACLLETHDVICIWNDRHIKIVFPGHSFPSEMQPYRPPQALQDAKIAKITSCDDVFAALTFSGELFTFSVANPSEAGAASAKEKSTFKPQRVWALRKKFSSDVALGSDGSIIVCTESGHVFVRTRNLKSGQSVSSGKAFKFQRLPALQRVIRVCANSAGSFGALRAEYQLKPIEVMGNNFAQDLAEIQPYLRVRTIPGRSRRGSDVLLQAPLNPRVPVTSHIRHDDGGDDSHVQRDIHKLKHILNILELQHKSLKQSDTMLYKSEPPLPHGGDVLVQAPSGFVFPAHRVILGARSHVLRKVLSGSTTQLKGSKISLDFSKPSATAQGERHPRLRLSGCQPISVLILLTFLYTDEVLAPWDHRVAMLLPQPLKELKIDLARVKVDLRALAELLELLTLAATLDSPIKSVPSPSLEAAMQQLFSISQMGNSASPSVLDPDVILLLADKEVYCHSTILRARSEFFADFFDEEDWTRKRWDVNAVLRVDMKHLNWRVMEYVLKFVCFGAEEKMFDSLEFANTLDQVLEFMFDVMSAANELLLDRLVLLCSAVILQHVNVHNACFILADATHLHAEQLIDRIQNFITVNMELFLETGMLEDMPPHLVKQLAQFAEQKQMEKSPISRSDIVVNMALEKHADWLALQDFPVPLGRQSQGISRKESASLKSNRPGSNSAPQQSPNIQPPLRRPPSTDDIFAMDEADTLPPRTTDHPLPLTSLAGSSTQSPALATPTPTPVWKAASAPRVDMKAVMAEAASATATAPRRTYDAARGSPSHNPPLNALRFQKSVDIRLSANANQQQQLPGPSTLRPGWRVSTDQVAARPSPPTTPSKESTTATAGSGTNSSSHVLPPSTPRRPSGPVPPTIPGLGPVITPIRQTSSPSAASGSSGTIRRASGKAWALPPSQPTISAVQPTTGMSFLAIQQLELDRLASDGAAGKDKRSLREIQEEEAALQAEADFLAWWTAEEERIKLERQAAEAAASGEGRTGEGSRRRGKGKVDQGKERRPREQLGSTSQAGGGGGAKRRPRKSGQKGGSAV
ncbi:hypothetical protein C0995_000024 [Termitomyces sp. Mi166|nr:hypothetical protein C0995_000024 [Termitomyces sp. Mi166\